MGFRVDRCFPPRSRNPPRIIFGHDVSPDGSKVAVVRNTASSNYGVWIMNVDGSGLTQVPTPSGWTILSVSWSPNGDYLAFERQTGFSQSDVYTIKTDGTRLTNLTNSGSGFSPDWGG